MYAGNTLPYIIIKETWMSKFEKFEYEGDSPDLDIETHLLGAGFGVHGVEFRHFELIQTLVYMSAYVYNAVYKKNHVATNSLLVTIDNKNKCVMCSASSYNPPNREEDQSNSAIVHGDKTSYLVTNGFIIDNFDMVSPTRDYITDEGQILITHTDIEELTTLTF